MMGRKMEEGDWADVYCRAKGIPNTGWSNLNIDVMSGNLGVEHKMLCYRSRGDLETACGTTLMHPSATRSIRIASTDADPNDVMVDVFTQYGELIAQRTAKVEEQNGTGEAADMRIGWLLWQESLRQFLYFEEPMMAPHPGDYWAEWHENGSGRGARKASKNLWIYERSTGKKRYSVTTSAGIKIQPYFDVPPPSDPNLYLFTVIGEVIDTGFIRVWLTMRTATLLRLKAGSLDPEAVSEFVASALDTIGDDPLVAAEDADDVVEVMIRAEVYADLAERVSGVNDENNFQLLLEALNNR